MHPKDEARIANSVDPDQQSDLGLHCLPRSICLKVSMLSDKVPLMGQPGMNGLNILELKLEEKLESLQHQALLAH